MEKYILTGNRCKAIAIRSSLNCMEIKDYVRENSHKLHPEGDDVVFKVGMIEFINPQVMSPGDFADFCPHFIAVDLDKD